MLATRPLFPAPKICEIPARPLLFSFSPARRAHFSLHGGAGSSAVRFWCGACWSPKSLSPARGAFFAWQGSGGGFSAQVWKRSPLHAVTSRDCTGAPACSRLGAVHISASPEMQEFQSPCVCMPLHMSNLKTTINLKLRL